MHCMSRLTGRQGHISNLIGQFAFSELSAKLGLYVNPNAPCNIHQHEFPLKVLCYLLWVWVRSLEDLNYGNGVVYVSWSEKL